LATVLGDAFSQASVTCFDFDAGEISSNVGDMIVGWYVDNDDNDDDDECDDVISRHTVEYTDAVNVGTNDIVSLQCSIAIGPSGNSLPADSSRRRPIYLLAAGDENETNFNGVVVEDQIPIHVRNMTADK